MPNGSRDFCNRPDVSGTLVSVERIMSLSQQAASSSSELSDATLFLTFFSAIRLTEVRPFS